MLAGLLFGFIACRVACDTASQYRQVNTALIAIANFVRDRIDYIRIHGQETNTLRSQMLIDDGWANSKDADDIWLKPHCRVMAAYFLFPIIQVKPTTTLPSLWYLLCLESLLLTIKHVFVVFYVRFEENWNPGCKSRPIFAIYVAVSSALA